MSESTILGQVVQQARRRAILQLLLDQGSLALAFAFAAVILLLFAGTQILDWYWPAIILLGTFVFGVWRLRDRIPTPYQVAQKVDSKLGLSDAISTALYFDDTDRKAPKEIVLAQRKAAESMAAIADVQIASPYRMPKQAVICLGLFVACGALLVVRYGFRGSLDLSQPLVRLPFDTLSGTPTVVAKNKAYPKQKMPEGMDALTVPSEGGEDKDGERKKAQDDVAFKGDTAEADGDPKDAQSAKQGKVSDQEGKESGEASEKGDASAAGDDKSQQDSSSNPNSPQNQKSGSQGGNKNNSQQNANNSSMMDKMRDAMANMMSRMRMTPQQGENSKQSANSQQGASQSASAQKQAGQKGSPSPGKQGEGQSKSDEAGEQEGEGASKNMNAQGKMSDAAGQKQMAQEGKSGAGKQDGEKDIKAAEQQLAMGKISELLGKRAKDLTGEIMVEVSSGRQQLKTQYMQKNAAHADSGGEISRDEVPAAYQQFVQQYFEEIRKPAGAAAAAAKPKPAPAAPAKP